MNEYQQALLRIIELEDDLALARAQNVDQLRGTLALLKKSRDLLEVVALESPLRRDIQELIAEIDLFYPRA